MTTKNHSASVSGWLVINDHRYELAQVGEDFCILRDDPPRWSTLGNIASVVVEVDGLQSVRPVKIVFCNDRKVDFRPMTDHLKTLLVIRDYLRSRRDSPSTGSIVALMLGDEVDRINKLIAKLEAK